MIQGKLFHTSMKVIMISVLSIAVQMDKTHIEDPRMYVTIFWINASIAGLFWVESGLKILAYDVRLYISASLNQFDFLICILSLRRPWSTGTTWYSERRMRCVTNKRDHRYTFRLFQRVLVSTWHLRDTCMQTFAIYKGAKTNDQDHRSFNLIKSAT